MPQTEKRIRPLPTAAVLAVVLGTGVAGASAAHAQAAPTAPGHAETSRAISDGAGGKPVATAEVTPISGRVDAPAGLNVHSGSPTGLVIGAMPDNSIALLNCWVSGPAVTGPGGTTTVWDSVESYTTPWGTSVTYVGAGGPALASDAWLDTGGDTSTMLPHC
jgi:hypothetical protein